MNYACNISVLITTSFRFLVIHQHVRPRQRWQVEDQSQVTIEQSWAAVPSWQGAQAPQVRSPI